MKFGIYIFAGLLMIKTTQAFEYGSLPYGWKVLSGIESNEAGSIYSTTNTRQHVEPKDVIPLVLGLYERCLATQYQTNPTYYVTPLDFVTNWLEQTNALQTVTNTIGGTTNVVVVTNFAMVTNMITNAFGWYLDRNMLISLDPKIKALVPYNVDTNTVYDGTTNIVMLTVTGLWASLGIGDGTNQFTSVPCWTNPPQTNWLVCYTSFWPTNWSADGYAIPTTNNYTSVYNQAVNYATSFDGTNILWSTITNWPSVVVQTTNAATYGDYPWRIYKEDLEERYKVLEALKMMKYESKIVLKNLMIKSSGLQGSYASASSVFSAAGWTTGVNQVAGMLANVVKEDSSYNMYRVRGQFIILGGYSTNISVLRLEAYGYTQPVTPYNSPGELYYYGADGVCPGAYNSYVKIKEMEDISPTNFPYIDPVIYGDSENTIPDPGYSGNWGYGWSLLRTQYSPADSRLVFIDWNFQYCTNAYW